MNLIGGIEMKLIVEQLEKRFDDKIIFDNVNFTFEKGKIYGLLGRNGAGKTTLFNCMNEDMSIDGGHFYLETDQEKRQLSYEDIGYVLSSPVVPDFLTGREFVKFFIDIHENQIADLRTVDEYLDLMKIDMRDRDKLMKEYSHGMKNKMQMLINLISKPEVLLLDEPLTSFDVVVAEEMKTLLRNIKGDHIIIFSTHIMDLALSLCDEVVILNNAALLRVEADDLNDEQLKSTIIHILKGEQSDTTLSASV